MAHRAGNDLAALRAAAELGVDVVEADVHRYRGRLEVRHSKALGPLPYLWDRGEPLVSTRVAQPQLSAVLDALRDARDAGSGAGAAHPGATLMLDLKGPGRVGRHVAQAVHDRQPDRPVLVCSRWWPGVDAFAGLTWARPLLTARNRAELARLRRRVQGPRAPYGVSLHGALLDPAVVAELRERVEVVLTWGVDDERCLEDVLSRGVTGVISDSAAVLAAVRGLQVRTTPRTGRRLPAAMPASRP